VQIHDVTDESAYTQWARQGPKRVASGGDEDATGRAMGIKVAARHGWLLQSA
jgi:hypothetical protein